MPGIGAPEILMVAVIGLIVFGPRRLPEIARSLGKSFAEFKRQASEIRSEFESGLDPEAPVDEKPAPPVDEKPAPPVDEKPAPPVDEKPAPPVDEKPAPPTGTAPSA